MLNRFELSVNSEFNYQKTTLSLREGELNFKTFFRSLRIIRMCYLLEQLIVVDLTRTLIY